MSKGSYPYPKFFCINLPERKDRLEEVRKSFKGWNIELDFIPAVKDTFGWKGCFASHLKCIEKARSNKLPWVVIIEDDCVPVDKDRKRFDQVLETLWNMKDKWEVFNGGPTQIKYEETKIIQKENPPIFLTKGQTTHFIVIHEDIYSKILKEGHQYIKERKDARYDIDVYYREFLKMACTYPNIAIQRESLSNIEHKSVNYKNLHDQTDTTLKKVIDLDDAPLPIDSPMIPFPVVNPLNLPAHLLYFLNPTLFHRGGKRRNISKRYRNNRGRSTTRKFKKRKYRGRQRGGGNGQCIYIHLMGGLGNQLCIYATGLSLSKKTGADLCSLPAKENKHSTRDYRSFMIGRSVEDDDSTLPPIVPKPNRYYKSYDNANINYENAKKGNTRLLDEYYQDFSVYKSVIPDIRDNLNKKEFSKNNYRRFDTQIKPDTSVFMHVRRGDFEQEGRIDNDEYFMKALREINKADQITSIYVLSDDINWCKGKEALWKGATSKSIVYMDIPDELEALYFMTLCKGGAILSSSTFSAWGALLGPNENPMSVIIYSKDHPYHRKVHPEDPQIVNLHNYPERWLAL